MFKQLTLCTLVLALSCQAIEARQKKHYFYEMKQTKIKTATGTIVKKTEVYPLTFYATFPLSTDCEAGPQFEPKDIEGQYSIGVVFQNNLNDTIEFNITRKTKIDSLELGQKIKVNYFDEFLRLCYGKDKYDKKILGQKKYQRQYISPFK